MLPLLDPASQVKHEEWHGLQIEASELSVLVVVINY